ncbi:pentatricopeptide repeat-containing protein [Senna tora]|uniref:Pentatricopeptide repeat-containing protein n=1 Tax=Senna tora TaxID=362788 RepID=A0A835CCY9_9FABA|nr:pentatricopeptide repeat-containing protein [Senna tora]
MNACEVFDEMSHRETNVVWHYDNGVFSLTIASHPIVIACPPVQCLTKEWCSVEWVLLHNAYGSYAYADLGSIEEVTYRTTFLNLYGRHGRYDDVHDLFLEVKGDYDDDDSNWQIVKYVFGKNSEECGLGMRFYNTLHSQKLFGDGTEKKNYESAQKDLSIK